MCVYVCMCVCAYVCMCVCVCVCMYRCMYVCMMAVLEDRLPDTQAGFRPARGCRDNVCALRWFIDMVLREGRQYVVTFIDYSAAFDTESQLFLDSALAEAGVNSKVRRIVQAIFAAATGVVRIRQQDGALRCRNHLTSREACCRGISSHPYASSQG